MIVSFRRGQGEVFHAGTCEWVAGLLRRAADAGLPTAMYLLGVMTERGQGMPQDIPAAVALYRQSAERGMRSGQARYGLALMQGNGIKADLQEGESWLRRAALQGDPDSSALVGDL